MKQGYHRHGYRLLSVLVASIIINLLFRLPSAGHACNKKTKDILSSSCDLQSHIVRLIRVGLACSLSDIEEESAPLLILLHVFTARVANTLHGERGIDGMMNYEMKHQSLRQPPEKNKRENNGASGNLSTTPARSIQVNDAEISDPKTHQTVIAETLKTKTENSDT